MERIDLEKLTDEALRMEKKKMKQSKMWHATWIGFLAGILIFGLVSWALSAQKNVGFIIPMMIPVFFIYKLLNAPNKYKDLEAVLRERNLQ